MLLDATPSVPKDTPVSYTHLDVYKRQRDTAMPSGFEVVIAGGTEKTGIDVVKWAKKCQELGAGVILPTSMDGDGTQLSLIHI